MNWAGDFYLCGIEGVLYPLKLVYVRIIKILEYRRETRVLKPDRHFVTNSFPSVCFVTVQCMHITPIILQTWKKWKLQFY